MQDSKELGGNNNHGMKDDVYCVQVYLRTLNFWFLQSAQGDREGGCEHKHAESSEDELFSLPSRRFL